MRASPAQIARTIAFTLAFYLGSIGYVLAALLAWIVRSNRFIPAVEAWSAYHAACARVLLGIHVQFEGTPPAGSVIVALKHESFYDAIDLPNLLAHPVVMAKAELLRIPLWGTVGRNFGLVGVEREQGARALRTMIAEARRQMDGTRPLAIFPEGTRVTHGTRPPLQAGFAGLYKLLALPVVPVAIDSGVLYNRLWKRPGTITIRFGEVIPAGLPRDVVEARVWEAINALNPVDTIPALPVPDRA